MSSKSTTVKVSHLGRSLDLTILSILRHSATVRRINYLVTEPTTFLTRCLSASEHSLKYILPMYTACLMPKDTLLPYCCQIGLSNMCNYFSLPYIILRKIRHAMIYQVCPVCQIHVCRYIYIYINVCQFLSDPSGINSKLQAVFSPSNKLWL